MIRAVLTPDKEKIPINVPSNFIGKKVEVIAFTIEETLHDTDIPLTHFASEKVLAKDWLTAEEDKAWQDL